MTSVLVFSDCVPDNAVMYLLHERFYVSLTDPTHVLLRLITMTAPNLLFFWEDWEIRPPFYRWGSDLDRAFNPVELGMPNVSSNWIYTTWVLWQISLKTSICQLTPNNDKAFQKFFGLSRCFVKKVFFNCALTFLNNSKESGLNSVYQKKKSKTRRIAGIHK